MGTEFPEKPSVSIDGTPISASLGTVELLSFGAGTKLIYTEQGAHLDGLDKPDMRRTGWAGLLEQLDGYLESASAAKF